MMSCVRRLYAPRVLLIVVPVGMLFFVGLVVRGTYECVLNARVGGSDCGVPLPLAS